MLGGVGWGSELQKKLIKNEKREGKGGGGLEGVGEEGKQRFY